MLPEYPSKLILLTFDEFSGTTALVGIHGSKRDRRQCTSLG